MCEWLCEGSTASEREASDDGNVCGQGLHLRSGEHPAVHCAPNTEVAAVFRESRLRGRGNNGHQLLVPRGGDSFSNRATHASLLVLPYFADGPAVLLCKCEDLEIRFDEPGPVMREEAQDGGSLKRFRFR